jgi:transposase
VDADPGVKLRFDVLSPLLDERARRLLVAAESEALGPRGVSAVARATGVSRRVIRQGMADLKQPSRVAPGRVRRGGGGRKRARDPDPSFRTDLEKLLESTTRGDPEAPLRWTCKSVRNLTAELNRGHHAVSHQVVADLLHEMGYSLQANRKTTEGASHPDRNAQFEHLNGKVKWSLSRKQPVISVDTKKKELVGDFKNGGRELRPKGNPEPVRVHDFIDKELARSSVLHQTDLPLADERSLPGNHLRGIRLPLRGAEGILSTRYLLGSDTPSAARICCCRASGWGSRVTVVFSSTV